MTDTGTRLDELTWEDARDRLADADYVALAVGSIEQHSAHLPLGVDVIRSEAFLAEMAAEAPRVGLDLVVLPTLPYGYAEHHMHFPGTITLTSSTLRSVVTDIGRSLHRHGVERFLVVNGHTGNEPALQLSIDELQREIGLTTHYFRPLMFSGEAYEDTFGDKAGHAGADETSEIEYYRPDLVSEDRKQTPDLGPIPETRRTRYTEDYSSLGGRGDPTVSDPDVAETAIRDAVERVLETLRAEMDRSAG